MNYFSGEALLARVAAQRQSEMMRELEISEGVPVLLRAQPERLCWVCGKPSDSVSCPACAKLGRRKMCKLALRLRRKAEKAARRAAEKAALNVSF